MCTYMYSFTCTPLQTKHKFILLKPKVISTLLEQPSVVYQLSEVYQLSVMYMYMYLMYM